MALPQTSRENMGRRAVLLLVLGIALLVPSLVWPGHRELYTYRTLALELAAIALLLFTGLRGSFSVEGARRFLRAGPNLAILLFVGWSLITYLDSPFQTYGRYQLLALSGGVIVYFAVAYALAARRNLQKLVAGLTGAVILSVIVASLFFEQQGSRLVASFGDSQLYAGFLVVLLPLVLAAAQAEENPLRRAAAQFATVLALGGILLTHNRSAWAGVVAGLLVMAVLATRSFGGAKSLLRHKHQVLLPAVLLVGAVALFIGFTGLGPSLLGRLATGSTSDPANSVGWRVDMWQAGVQIWQSRPIEGGGVGSYPLFAGYVSNAGIPLVLGKVPTLSNIAHNFYVQTLAETGLIGLGLYLAILVGFFVRCSRALKQGTSQTRQWLLVGSMAAVAAQAVDAFGSPAWQFGDVAVFFWLAMGIGIAASRPRAEREAVVTVREPVAVMRPSRLGWALAQVAIVACAAVLASATWAQSIGSGSSGSSGGGTTTGAVITGIDTGYVEVVSCRIVGPTKLRKGECADFTVLATFRRNDGTTFEQDVTASSTFDSSSPCLTPQGAGLGANRFCATTSNADLPCDVTLTATFNPGAGAFQCSTEIVLRVTKGGGGGNDNGGGGGGGAIIGAIAGAGLLFFLLGRKKKHGGGKGGDEKGGGCDSGYCPPGTVPGGGLALNMPSYERVTSIRTEPDRLIVNNGEEGKVRVFVQLDGQPHWYDVTDHPDTDFGFENGTATLVASAATEDRYMVTRSQLKRGDLKVKASFHGQVAEVPVSFRAP